MIRLRTLGIAALVPVLLGMRCFSDPEEQSLYACNPDQSCPNAAHRCEDGVCCTYDPTVGPLCPSCSQPCSDPDRHGMCQAGIWQCLPGGERVCGQTVSAEAESCDGQDNNCDGQVDEDADSTCPSQARCEQGACCALVADAGIPACAGCGGSCSVTTNLGLCRIGSFVCTTTGGYCAAQTPQPEVCDGLDNNCNGTPDDGADSACPAPGKCNAGSCCSFNLDAGNNLCPGCGVACNDAVRKGLCKPGIFQCTPGGGFCAQTVFPQIEICDTLDNDCDGQVDESQVCGGPTAFRNEPSAIYGVKHLAVSYNGAPSGCVKNAAASPTAPDSLELNDTFSYPEDNVTWQGNGNTSHVIWVEIDGGYWDLRTAGKQLTSFYTAHTVSPFWATNHTQPIILLCGPAGYIRLAPSPAAALLQNNQYNPYDNYPVTLRGDAVWAIQPGSAANLDSVLQRVERVEFLVQPSGSNAFEFYFQQLKWGFK